MSPLKHFSILSAAALLFSTWHVQATNSLPAIELRDAYPALKFERPLWMEEMPDGSKRTIVVEQAGKIWMLPQDRNGVEKKLFLDMTARRPYQQNEEGLLAFAFHPQFKANGKFYLFYTAHGPMRTVLSEMQVLKSDTAFADPSTERLIMTTPRPYWNHDGGTLIFDKDGFLYLSTGDGGMGGDPHNVGQSLHHLLGKILRIDVNATTGRLPYGIPKDNPFVAKEKDGTAKADPFDTKPDGMRPEIWAYGLRNVWRMSFDRETGELWAADVGQDKWEEVNLITKGGNYGWSVREGFHPFKDGKATGQPLDPIIEYAHKPELASQSKFPDHGTGISITGGYVYRGKKNPNLRGVYLYADYQTGTVWGLRQDRGQLTAHGELCKGQALRNISCFAEDRDGELYVLAFDGKIYSVVEAAK